MLFVTAWSANAQSILKGKIIDQHTSGELPGATIIDNTTAAGTTTNERGEFALTLLTPETTITVSYIGYETQTISVNSKTQVLNIRLTSTNLQLSEVTVVGFDNNRKLIETAGAIAVLNQREIQRATNVSLGQTLNIIPGVRMEENGLGGTSRVSIRGSLLRSPWGIRNIKVYWNDVPLTDPSGTSARFNAIDVQSIGTLEVIKGPSGSIFGAGTGGVISLTSAKAGFGENTVDIGNTFGAYGLRRTSATVRIGGEKSNIVASYVNQDLDGYRQHQRSDKQTFNLTSEFNVSANRSLAFHLFHYDGEFDLPGSLSEAEVKANRKQALAFNRENDCRLSNKSTGIAISQRYEFDPRFENLTSVSAVVNAMDHPWGSNAFYNGYSIGSSQALTIRSRFIYTPSFNRIKSKFTAGAELQKSNDLEKEYQNDGGKPGDMQGDYELQAQQAIVFAQGEFTFPYDLIVTIGASYNATGYDFTSRLTSDPELDIKFDPSFAPRIAVVKKLSDNVSVHGSVSYGFSPPTQWEVQTQAGINPRLEAEHGTNYEAGMRGSVLQGLINFDVSGYTFNLKNAILPRYNDAQQEFFENTGSTQQNGFEAILSFLPIHTTGAVRLLKPWVSYTYNHYTFDEYKKEILNGGEVVTLNYSGNKITGIPSHILNWGIDLQTAAGIYGSTTLNYVSEIPLTDANSVEAKAYTTVAAKLGWKTKLGRSLGIDGFLAVDNAFNASYNNFLSLNASDNRYYNPAAERNFFGGISINYQIHAQK